MASKPIRIVVDTNLWISFLISNNFSKLDKLIASGKVTILFSEELLNEFLEVVARPKLKKYFNGPELTKILTALDDHADYVEVTTKINVCRDKKDNFLLSLAYDGKADFLLTGDVDLLILKKYKKTIIIKITDFLKV